jgi:hypothetical protein
MFVAEFARILVLGGTARILANSATWVAAEGRNQILLSVVFAQLVECPYHCFAFSKAFQGKKIGEGSIL